MTLYDQYRQEQMSRGFCVVCMRDLTLSHVDEFARRVQNRAYTLLVQHKHRDRQRVLRDLVR